MSTVSYWTTDMAASLSFLGILGCVATFLAIACYYLWVIAPYSKFPSHRFDIRIVYWILKRQPIRTEVLTEIEKISKKYQKEGMFVAWLGSPLVVVYGEEAVKTIMNEPEAVDKPMFYNTFKHFMGSAIILSNGEEWRKQKKIVYPAFKLSSLKDMTPTFNKHSRDLVKMLSELNNGTTDELLHISRDFSLRMFLESSLGQSEGGEKQEEYTCLVSNIVAIMQFLVERIMKPWLYPDFALHIFPSGRRILKTLKEAITSIEKILDDMKEKMLSPQKDATESSDRRPKLLGEILINEHLKDPSFTMLDVFWQTAFLIMAGSDTSAVAVMWSLFLLGHHQDVQERVYRELEELESKPGEDLRYEELQGLEYLECVIKESMRIYSVVPIIGRHLNKDVQIGKYNIPKHSSVLIPIFRTHKNPEIFSDPEKFDPERFSTKESGIKQRSYVPFAEGARACPGKTYALIQVKIILTHILRKFKVVSLDCKKDVELSIEMLTVPVKPLRMQFIARDSFTPSISDTF